MACAASPQAWTVSPCQFSAAAMSLRLPSERNKLDGSAVKAVGLVENPVSAAQPP
ncbi:hypothetical protein ACFVAV_17615 [Nocardia sp. NPDC057663]|uniref:hypothetical protein n=1 Tax=Nocardia sp. NPDC057663 TaxID=3346201 RepID=UPI00366FD1FD